MGIHQALIGGYPSVVNWEVAIYHEGDFTFEVPASSLEANDLIVFVAGADSNTTVNVQPGTLNTTTLSSGRNNGIDYVIEYGVVPDPPSEIKGLIGQADYGLVMGFRRSGSTSSYNVSTEATNTTTTSPSHNNTSVAFSKDDLAFLLALVDDDATTMTPPTDSTIIGEDRQTGDGSVGAAYKQINAAGNYSWGSWTTIGTDNTLAFVIKIQEA